MNIQLFFCEHGATYPLSEVSFLRLGGFLQCSVSVCGGPAFSERKNKHFDPPSNDSWRGGGYLAHSPSGVHHVGTWINRRSSHWQGVGGGFSISSQSNNFVNDDPSLYYVHASASGNGFDFAQPLFTAVQVIEADSGHGHN
jgi:hypothetical protein